MSTTQLYSGLGDGERSSSRVLQPPGGGSSNIFGAGEPEQVKVKDYYKSDIFNQRDGNQNTESLKQKPAEPVGAAAAPFASDVAPPPEPAKAPTKPAAESNPIAPTPTAPAPAPAPQRRGGSINPITGAEMGAPSQQPSTRVRQPPGGASSGLW